ncbi:MAG: alpha/beta hydrolase [Bacteroidales bacterium]|nr:alpha/beta hydrolase [Bacteroidales bacterium]
MNAVLYIHGKDGNAAESEHYKPLFPDCEVIGLDYQTFTPWETGREIHKAVEELKTKYESIILIANSIGAYFSMNADIDGMIMKAYFISPVVDMEKLNGIELTGERLRYVRNHPIRWNVQTHILYGSYDSLVPFDAVSDFATKHNATLTVMEGGEHWFHTEEQMQFLDEWIKKDFLRS